ncbi:MAG: acyl-ACP--UDP-N-acetylglucosamine O-acyltransferase [Candidatus Omnitrophica bacterium]|nr:acyl-ACP--UDP-N-acetylglucosamine O-acyltransferase [Candidatus Omnitrophota bacterium]
MVHPKAVLGEQVTVGPYAIVGEHVKLGANTVLDAFSQVLGFTELGKNCRLFSYAVVGNIPQDLKYCYDETYLKIGDNNQFREFCTVNPGTLKGTQTLIGNNNLFMTYAHVAHDCIVGDNNVFANNATLAGHVTVGNKAILGGLVAIHQFCRVGDYAIVGGCSKVTQDIPPYSMSDGHPAKICGINLVGLRRAKFSNDLIRQIKQSFKLLFFENHSFEPAAALVREQIPKSKEVDNLLSFVLSSKRGISR